VEAGDAAEPSDVWLRPITNETHLKRATVHHGALKKWIEPPDDPTKPWKLEVSGRLRSLVEGISADAIRKVDAQKAKLVASNKNVPSALKYCGILYSLVDEVRAITEFQGDVIFEPTDGDPAHANIVIRDKGPTEILTVTDVLIKKLTFLSADQVAQDGLFSSCA
jgi:hypothetical protein